MAERTRWRSLHDQLVIENEALKKERDEAVERAVHLEQEMKGRDNCIDALKRAVERAKLEGAYDLAAVEHFGQFAWLNFPQEHKNAA